ncbi:MAG: DUF6090 family protein [Gilvibacter sp.]
MKALRSNSAVKYLLYAVGEIALVVVGILIALAINNKNEVAKTQNQLEGILKNVRYDLELDTLRVGQAIKYYESREEVVKKILNKEYSKEDYKTCILCGSLVTTYVPISLNDKGYNQLKGFVENSKQKDSLAVGIVQMYNGFFTLIGEISGNVKENTFQTLELWRDTQPWFADIMTNTPSPAYLNYISESTDYRNRVAYFNIIACQNLLPLLRMYKENAAETIDKLNSRLEEVSQK